MQQPSVIELINLSKTFRDFWGRPKVKAVVGLNLDIKKGEVYGLLGPNGSGKSTTIKMMLGLLFPTSGSIRVFGKSPRDVRAKMLIGYMPEESNLYRFLNAEETLDFYGRLFNFSSKERDYRTKALLELVGLTRERRRPLSEYSKGMSRRIGLAQALVNDPELAILDEPTTGLDPIGTREVKDLILDLKNRGKTVLLCSHLLADVEDVCDRIGILYGGRVIAQGKVNELLARTNITRISTGNLKADTLNRMVELIKKEMPDSDVKIDNPSQKLEEFFLNVVEAAREKQIESSGVEAGRAASDVKLAGEAMPIKEKRSSVLSKLMRKKKDEKPEIKEDAIAVPKQESRRDKVLTDLTSIEAKEKTEKEKNNEEKKAHEAETEKQRQSARKNVLERLKEGDKDKDGSNA
jgi:ABC-2 type transport system ATP-binding protein